MNQRKCCFIIYPCAAVPAAQSSPALSTLTNHHEVNTGHMCTDSWLSCPTPLFFLTGKLIRDESHWSDM